jgi:hypothetical protein
MEWNPLRNPQVAEQVACPSELDLDEYKTINFVDEEAFLDLVMCRLEPSRDKNLTKFSIVIPVLLYTA